MSEAARGGLSLPLTLSLLLHAAAAATLLLVKAPPPPPALPPTYKVNLVAAPAGERAIGVVRPPDAKPPEQAAPAPARPVTERAKEPAVPLQPPKPPTRKTPAKSTPTPPDPNAARARPTTPAPTAGGGPVGGRGTDVATVRTQGIEFPFPGYLENVVRQIALRFKPPRGAGLRADVSFLIRRDGTVSDVRMLKGSGSYAFDLEARGAIEAAAQAGAFGALPPAFRDDALPVIFSFDPRLIR